jgi:Domain of unknown function (DUF4062)
MAKSSKIKVMISSRCDDVFPLSSKTGLKLTDLRRKLKSEFEAAVLFGERPYEIWIHEQATEDAELDAWDECLRQARECDIFVALYNGNAGWPGGQSGAVGICHEEFSTAYSQAPGKVFIVNIFEASSPKRPSRREDREFQKLIDSQFRFGRIIKDPKTLEKQIRQTIVQATVKMVQRGVKEANRGKGYLGPALDWNRQNYSQRQASMVAALRSALKPNSSERPADPCIVNVDGRVISFHLSAIPDSVSVAAARELVGQPHLMDHTAIQHKSDGGPVHIIACHKGVTATQAQRMLGFPNATVVNAPFGIYVLDTIQAIQLVLISNCADATQTRHGVQSFMAWLHQAEQSEALVRFARKRKEIVKLLAQTI